MYHNLQASHTSNRANIKDLVWVDVFGRKLKLLGDAYRPMIKYTIREFGEVYKAGREHGKLKHVGVHGNCVQMELQPASSQDSPLNLVFLGFIKPLLGDATHNHELKHFYEMIKKCSEKFFWIMEYHLILLDIEERAFLPAITRVGLEDHADWERFYEDYGRRKFSPFKVLPAIPSQSWLVVVYHSNNNQNTLTGFTNNCVGLTRFSRALVIHGSDPNRNVPLENVEYELSNRFPEMLLQLFEFLLLDMSQRHKLTFLKNIRPGPLLTERMMES